MARNSIRVNAPVDVVWDVLADPFAYADWVVGAQHIRAADPSWPEPPSRLHHRVGFGPLGVRDRTRVVEADPPRRIVLDAAARPLGRARVEIVLTPDGDGTRVELVEDPSGYTSLLRFNPAIQALIRMRNVESLRRFRDVAERRRRSAERSAARGRRPTRSGSRTAKPRPR